MATIRQMAIKKLGGLNCTLTDDGDAITIDSPRGKIMTESGCHCVVLEYRGVIKYTSHEDGKKITGWRDANATEKWQAILDILDVGVEDCTDPDCELCN